MVGLLHLFWGEKGRLLCPRWCRTSTTPLGWAMLTSLSIQQCLTMQGFTQKVPILKTNTPTHHSPHFPLSPRTKPSSIPVSLELSHNLPDSQFQQFQVTRLTPSWPVTSLPRPSAPGSGRLSRSSNYNPSTAPQFTSKSDAPLKNNEKICSPELSNCFLVIIFLENSAADKFFKTN